MGCVRQQSQAAGKDASSRFDFYLACNQAQDQHETTLACGSIVVGMIVRSGTFSSGMVDWVGCHFGVSPEPWAKGL